MYYEKRQHFTSAEKTCRITYLNYKWKKFYLFYNNKLMSVKINKFIDVYIDFIGFIRFRIIIGKSWVLNLNTYNVGK